MQKDLSSVLVHKDYILMELKLVPISCRDTDPSVVRKYACDFLMGDQNVVIFSPNMVIAALPGLQNKPEGYVRAARRIIVGEFHSTEKWVETHVPGTPPSRAEYKKYPIVS